MAGVCTVPLAKSAACEHSCVTGDRRRSFKWLNGGSTWVKPPCVAQETKMNFAGRDWLERCRNSDVCSFWTHSIPPHSLWDLLTSCIIQVSRCWALGICLSPETHCPASQDWCAPCLQQSDFVDCLNAIKPKSCWPDLITCCWALLHCLSSELLEVVYKQLIKAWNSLLRRYGDTNFHFYFSEVERDFWREVFRVGLRAGGLAA